MPWSDNRMPRNSVNTVQALNNAGILKENIIIKLCSSEVNLKKKSIASSLNVGRNLANAGFSTTP